MALDTSRAAATRPRLHEPIPLSPGTGPPTLQTTCGFTAANNSLSSAAPMLDPELKNNGGPTAMHALLAGSAAINAIPAGQNGCGTTITTDQRGVSRPQDSACDIGAFELEPTPRPPTYTFLGFSAEVAPAR